MSKNEIKNVFDTLNTVSEFFDCFNFGKHFRNLKKKKNVKLKKRFATIKLLNSFVKMFKKHLFYAMYCLFLFFLIFVIPQA